MLSCFDKEHFLIDCIQCWGLSITKVTRYSNIEHIKASLYYFGNYNIVRVFFIT